ncbi:MAG TPA: aldehyde dehydrogenase family protein [Bryobacteraceae bacterium]|nr:aldehyde dehydrogenase family protein [Bryobacteraceae bacterium]
MLHIPLLRRGTPYRSVDVAVTKHYSTGEPFVEISQANSGLIRRDLLRQAESRAALAQFTTAELIGMCRRAAEYFLNDSLPLGDAMQSPQDYVEQLSATTGMPFTLVRRNMNRVTNAMREMEQVVRGLTRGLPFEALDKGYAAGSPPLSYFPRAHTLGVVLPNNSPGVHSLWIPAIALKTALVLRPGSAEPWTPYRIIQALIKAGVPPVAFHFYPSDHAAGGEIMRTAGRGMIFGDATTMKGYANDPRIEIHGPGFSKVVLDEHAADEFDKYLDVMVDSIAANSGRSCVNASGVWTPRNARKIAEALADRLEKLMPRPADDPDAALSPFVDPGVAQRISAAIDGGLTEPGATDILNRERLVNAHGGTYLLPTIVYCESPDHTRANREYLFPFASVVECPQNELVSRMGPTLAVTALTEDTALRNELLASSHVGRLNMGAIPTNQISWDQPHEGNLFDHLYARRAFQAA